MSPLSSLVSPVLLVVAGTIHLLPLAGVLGRGHLAQLYGLAPAALADPNLLLLLRHRAVLFGLVGGLLLWAAADAGLRRPALVVGGISAATFLVLARAGGSYNAQLARVVTADVVALVCLIIAGIAHAVGLSANGAARVSGRRVRCR